MRQPHVLGVDEENNERLNTIVELLRTTFVVDIAVLSLLEAERQWFKAAPGIEVCCRDGQTEFGSWALSREHAAMLVVEDALQDARFNTNPLVTGPPHLRFYAGAPLMGSDGSVYGMLYIADRKPRHFAAEQLSILGGFAEVCTRKLEAPRLQELQQRAAEAEEGLSQPLKRDLGVVDEAVLLCNMETEHWEIRWGNAKFAELAGIAQPSAPGRDVWELFQVIGVREHVLSECDAAIFCKQSFVVTVTVSSHKTGAAVSAYGSTDGRLELRFRPASLGLPSAGIPAVGIPSDVESELGHAPHDSLAAGFEHLYWVQVAPAGATALLDSRSGAPVLPVAGAASARSASKGGQEGRGPSFTVDQGNTQSVSFSGPAKLTQPDSVFQKVTLGPLLGAGAYGRAYRAQWRGVEAAVKVMDYYTVPITGLTDITAEKNSALLEALLGREFTRHPALVQTYDYGLRPVDPIDPADPPTYPVRHTLWVVTELCNRGTLADAVSKGRFRITPSNISSGPNILTILLTAQDIAGGMSLLHDHGIVHSDLSANNVLLKAAANNRRFTAAVSDFGLSRMCADMPAGQCTQTVGTVTHQPPELFMKGLLTSAADVYAFGVLLWTMYTGEQPFAGDLPATVIYKVTSGRQCPLELPAEAPQGFKDLFERCVAYDRAQRPTFHQVLSLLVPLVEKAEAETPLLVGSPTRRTPGNSPFAT